MPGESIRDLPTPPRVKVPLVRPDGQVMTPLVKPGQHVRAGTAIGQTRAEYPAFIHAPLAGRVTGLVQADTAFMTDVPAVEIVIDDSSDRPAQDKAGSTRDRHESTSIRAGAAGSHSELLARAGKLKHTPAKLAELAGQHGIINTGNPPTGLEAILLEAAALRPRHFIINGLQHEPFLTAGPRVLRERLGAILAGGLVVRDALSTKRIWLAIDAADRAFVKTCRLAVMGTPIRVVPLPNKYPQAAAPLLAWTVTGRETPYGRRPIHAGVLVIDAEPLAELWSALQDGAPVTSRVVAVSGPAALQPGYYRVPVGTCYGDLIAGVGMRSPVVRIIDGGPMTGRSIESLDAVVSQTTNAILLIDRDNDQIPRPGPCIRCGQCQEHCPTGLDPMKLLDTMERGLSRQAPGLFPLACLECGLCSYVCSAELPLAEAAAQLKRHVSTST